MPIDFCVITILEGGFIVVIIAFIQLLAVIQLLDIGIERFAQLADIDAEILVGCNLQHTLDDARSIQTELVHQRHGLPRLAKAVVHTNATYANGVVFSQKLRHGTTQSTSDLMFLNSKDHSGFLSSLVENIAIQRLDGVHVDDASGDIQMLQHVSGFQGFPHLVTRGHKGNIRSLAHQLRLPNLKVLVFIGKIRYCFTPKTHINRTFAFQNGFLRSDFGLRGVAGRNHSHVGQHTHGGDVLQSLVGGTIGADRYAGMSTANDDMHIVVTHRNTNLVVGTMCSKNAVGAKHGELSTQGQASRSCHGILLSDAHGEKTFGVCLRKEVHPHRIGDVGTQSDHPFILLSRSENSLAEACLCGFVAFISIVHAKIPLVVPDSALCHAIGCCLRCFSRPCP